MSIIYPPGTDEAVRKRTDSFYSRRDTNPIALIKQGICIDAYDNDHTRTPLHYAVTYYDAYVVKALIDAGAKLEKQDGAGMTPLMRAAQLNASEALKVLIAADANINAKEPTNGLTALHNAIRYKEIWPFNILIAAGANIEARCHKGMTPLMRAASCNNLAAIKTLLKAGANIEAQDEEDKTALYHATEKNRLDAANMLITAGANIEARDAEGMTPLATAVINNQPEATQTLLNKGASLYVHDYSNIVGSVFELNHYDCAVEPLAKYKDFLTHRVAPVNALEVYQLLSATPIVDPFNTVDYAGNLQHIFTYANWQNKAQAETILHDIQKDGLITSETAETILASTFSRERSPASLLQGSGRGR